jgi:CubicO group peptidase (beta-lactamase class C family)
MKRTAIALTASLALVAALSAVDGPPATPDRAKVDAVFAKWTANTPGCAVGVAEDGKTVLEKAYGMADLEHHAPNAANTIFEAGSIAKQFTAAAVLLLAREGKLSLDDPARKHVPELPDYGKPLTIRHMLTHTSGLRDWSEVVGIAGWPRTSRVYTHAHVLDIVSRQKSLNFEPGTYWSYCNTGYNLAAIIVSRVSGMPFAEFCRVRIFEPLGMTRTSWRDDFRRIVEGRAIAYSEGQHGYRQNMPFENVHGNAGLLTTVGDLLKWSENAVTRKVGDAAFLREQLEPGRFNNGRSHDYALGLYIRTFMGVPEIGHDGSTGGYRAYLARYPKQRLSVAVLCNIATGEADRYAHQVAALYLGDALTPPRSAHAAAAEGAAARQTVLATHAGLYRSTVTGMPLGIVHTDGQLILADLSAPAHALVVGSESHLESPVSGRVYDFGSRGLEVSNPNGTVDLFERVEQVTPSASELLELAGAYSSDEAETVLEVSAAGNGLILKRRPDTALVLKPIYRDAFLAQDLGLVRFRRDSAGTVTALSVTAQRVWDLRFERVK